MPNDLPILGADTANQQAGGPSFLDNTVAFTAGAVVSGLAGIYNTGVHYANKFGADAEPIDVAQTLEHTDRDWFNYYKDNTKLVDTVGFVGASLIPGTLAIKGLKLAQAGRATGAIGRAITGPLNYAAAQQDAYLAAGLKQIASEGGSVFSYINANKIASMSWGTADAVLQNAAFSSAVALTMSESPTLADASKTDMFTDIAWNSLIGGVLGGAIGIVQTNRAFKDVVKGVANVQRKYDVVPNFTGQGLGLGDEAYGFTEALLKAPKEVIPGDQLLTVKNSMTGKTDGFDIGSLLQKSADKAQIDAMESFRITLNKMGGEDGGEFGKEFGDGLVKMIKEGVAKGASADEIQANVGNYTLGMKSGRALTTDIPLDTKDVNKLFYVSDNVDLAALAEGKNDIASLLDAARNRTPFAKNATAKPIQVIGDPSEATMAVGVTKFSDAWSQGKDMAIIGGKLRFNPDSQIFRKVTDPVLIPQRYLNTRTMGVSDEVVPTWADMLGKGTKAETQLLDDGVLYGKTALKLADNITPADSITVTARHAWASKLDVSKLAGTTVDINDISRMERIIQSGVPLPEGLMIRGLDGIEHDAASMGDLRIPLTQAKLQRADELMNPEMGGLTDTREVAYHLAVPEDWIERATANGWNLKTPADDLATNSWRNLDEFLKKENFIASWESPRSLVSVGAVPADLLAKTETAANSKGAKYLDSFQTGDLGFRARVTSQQALHLSAFTAVLGKDDAARFLDVNAKELLAQANEVGTGAGLFSLANASYGQKLDLWAQTTGKLTHMAIQKAVDANLGKLQPYTSAILENKQAGAELGVITTMLRRSPDKFRLITDAATGKQQLVVRELIEADAATGVQGVSASKLADWKAANPGKEGAFIIENSETADFLNQWKAINADRIGKKITIMNARGMQVGWDPEAIYAPPIDTQKFPFHAFVKIKEGHIAGNSDVGMITARSAEELNTLSRAVDGEKYDVFYKGDTEKYFKAKSEYDNALTIGEPRVDSNLRREGKLGDFMPEVRSQSVLEDYVNYSKNADTSLVRQAVDTRYAQLNTELNALGEQFTKVATSQTSNTTKLYDKTAINPFGDYVRTALDISKRSSFPLISQLNEFVDSAGTTAYRILVANTEKAKSGLISYQEAEALSTKYGIGGAFTGDNVATLFNVANRPMDRNLIREAVSKVNSFLATTGLRLDFANSFVNIISTPMMMGTELASLKSLAQKDPKMIGALNELTSINPQGTVAVPSMLKVAGQAIANVMGKDGKALIEKYRATGDVKDAVSLFHEMTDSFSIRPKLMPSEWSKAVDKGVAIGAKITGSDWAEDFTRAVSANIMDQLTAPLIAAGHLTQQEAGAYISTFVNRVNGNYIASQRPISFQGTVGSAVSLFQTYMFNVMQQMTRHIEDRSTRALLTMGGLQGSLYGLNGLPFFDAINTHLIGNAAINDGHRDIYSTTTQLAGKEMGNWLMYGSISALPLFGDKSPALYSRGDLNPRHITVLPVSPLDIPAVNMMATMAKNIYDVGGKISNGGSLGASLLEGLEHNGTSRPLAGFAQVVSGYATTGKGSLVSSANEFDSVVATTRMLGARPMDEAVGLNALFRVNAYRAADQDRLNRLGEAVKTKLRNNQTPTDEELQGFMKNYAAAGGNIAQYSGAMQRWQKDANTSVVEKLKSFHSSQYGQRLTEIMGGSGLSDYAGHGTPPASTETPPIQATP